jgi:hypothetical protein
MSVNYRDIEKGDILIANCDGYGYLVRDRHRRYFELNEELLVTSVSRWKINVKKPYSTGYNPVFSVGLTDVDKPDRLVGHTPLGAIAPTDPRVEWIFEDAARMADRLGLCRDYDRLCDALGWPGRIRTWAIKAAGLDEDGVVEVVVKVKARTRAQALEKINGRAGVTSEHVITVKALES